MGKKPQRHDWPEAKQLCRLNQNDIAMAKRLGFGPGALIRCRPDPKQKWKLPVKYWIHELHFKRFGHVIGEQPLAAVPPTIPPYTEEDARRFEEQMYWEDYHARNSEPAPKKRKGKTSSPAVPAPPPPHLHPVEEKGNRVEDLPVFIDSCSDEDLPF